MSKPNFDIKIVFDDIHKSMMRIDPKNEEEKKKGCLSELRFLKKQLKNQIVVLQSEDTCDDKYKLKINYSKGNIIVTTKYEIRGDDLEDDMETIDIYVRKTLYNNLIFKTYSYDIEYTNKEYGQTIKKKYPSKIYFSRNNKSNIYNYN
tara:strand:+ start:212 stop:655 length:444 start_codon:yes stop_codon:yes gene_type:complete